MKYFTPEEIGEMLKVNEEQVIKWIEDGVLQAIKIDDVFRISEDEFKKFIESLHRNKNSVEEINLIRQKTNAYYILVEWLQNEIQMLSDIYRDLEHVLEHTVEYLRGHLDNHRKSGDHHHERYLGNYLMQVFDHWEKPRSNYQNWLHKHENRWDHFQDLDLQHKYLENENLDLYFHQTEWPQIYKPYNSFGFYPSRGHQEVVKKNTYYYKKYIWLKKELDDLCKHYHKVNKIIKKMIRKLLDARKKCSKEMDFKKGYLIHEIITMLYLQLEKPREKYNFWLMGKEERWQEFKGANISRLRIVDEISEAETVSPINHINSNYIEVDTNFTGKNTFNHETKIDYNNAFNKDLIRDEESDYPEEFDEI